MKKYQNNEWLRLSLKAELTPEEESRVEAWLAGQPHERASWEEGRALGRALQALPDAPVSSNFTARIWQQIDAEEVRATKVTRSGKGEWWRVFLPRLGWATAAVALTVAGTHEFRVSQQKQLARDVSFVGHDLAAAPAPEVLQDFDAINQLRQVAAGSDDELLIALQQ